MYGAGDDQLVYAVSWYDAVDTCDLPQSREGFDPVYSITDPVYLHGSITGAAASAGWTKNSYRLPSEAKGEFAALGGNAGNGHVYSGSDNLDLVGWYDGSSGYSPHSIGIKAPNEFGNDDMSGKALELCWDWLDDYPTGPQGDPHGPDIPRRYRVLRGGYWMAPVSCCTIDHLDIRFP